MQRLNPGCLDVTAKLGLFLITRNKTNVKTNTVLIRHEMSPLTLKFFKIVWENEVFFVGHQNLSAKTFYSKTLDSKS